MDEKRAEKLAELLEKLDRCDQLMGELGQPVLAAGLRTYRAFMAPDEPTATDEEATPDGDQC